MAKTEPNAPEGPIGDNRKCAVVALIGVPNAGKSTLLNQLVGAKVSIVTHKVQTTRARIRGIVVKGVSQLVLVDTPGIFAPRRRLDRAMVETAWGSARDADITVFMLDAARGNDADAENILHGLSEIRTPLFLVLNKVDLVKKDALLAMAEEAGRSVGFEKVFMISALTRDGIDDFVNDLAERAPAGPWLYPEDQISDAPLRQLAAEITREKLTLRLHQELPYAATVETTGWKELRGRKIRIEQTIYVMRDSQKKIVLGKQGQTVKSISMDARRELAGILDAPVDLFIFVKVRQNWGDDPERYREMGLEFPKE